MTVNDSCDMRISIFCVGNKLALDDGLGCAVYEELTENYSFPEGVDIHDVGCMSLNMIESVNECDYIITVDAVDDTGEDAGTIFEFRPDDMQARRGATASLHELTLKDLFEAAKLLGYEANGKCFGMQVDNASPIEATIGLTPDVDAAIPLLVDCVLADLYAKGVAATFIHTGQCIEPNWSHNRAMESR